MLPYGKPATMWRCKCSCGREVEMHAKSLWRGTKSCGCRRGQFITEAKTKHGGAGTPEFKIWVGMRNRCNNPNNQAFRHYGGRGIKVCERWNDFSSFLEDMGKRPRGACIERLNNDADYSPENCAWSTDRKFQSRNRRGLRQITINGVTRCKSEWAEINGLKEITVDKRIKKGWPEEIAVTKPARFKRPHKRS